MSPLPALTHTYSPHDTSVYEFLYTSMGQAIAAYAPNEYFAAISNPLLLGCGLISFCGVVVPYAAMQPFWRYWLYYLDPFNYLVGGLLGTIVWDVRVQCAPEELSTFDPPAGQTCGAYMAGFLASNGGYVENGDATAGCRYCPYATGADYARTFNLNEEYYAWRDVSGPPGVLCFSSVLAKFSH
jgi:ABC-type multidrug transport system permease subunit